MFCLVILMDYDILAEEKKRIKKKKNTLYWTVKIGSKLYEKKDDGHNQNAILKSIKLYGINKNNWNMIDCNKHSKKKN